MSGPSQRDLESARREVEAHTRATSAWAAQLPDVAALRKIAELGWRTGELVQALEALADDASLADGDIFAVLARQRPTRGLVLLTRLGLGVGPTQRSALHTRIERLADAPLRAWLGALLDPAAPGVASRLADARDEVRSRRESSVVDLALRRAALAALPHATTWMERRRLRRFGTPRHGTPVVGPVDVLDAAVPMSRRLPDDPWRRRSAPVPLGDVRLRAARVAPAPTAPSATLDAAAYRVFRGGGATMGAATLRETEPWPIAGRVAALDGLADAPAVSTEILEALTSLTWNAVSRATRSRDDVPADWLDALAHALVRHAPNRWAGLLERLADAPCASDRAAAAFFCGWGPACGARGTSLLAQLGVDPHRDVRAAAHAALVDRMQAWDSLLWARRVVWAALRDDSRAAQIAERALPGDVHVPELSRAQVRSLRRLLDTSARSRRATRWIRAALPLPVEEYAVAASSARADLLVTTDGQRIAVVTRAIRDRDDGTLVVAQPLDPRWPSHEEVVRFVALSPSSFMRRIAACGDEHAVRVRVVRGDVVISPADPAMLPHLA